LLKQSRFLALLCMVIFSFSLLNGQTSTTGSVAGVVTDPTSAILPGSVVVLKSLSTGATQTTKSNSSGSYRFDLVPPGDYTLTVDQAGFSKMETTITVANAQVLGVDLKLTVGSESQTINVEAVASTLQTENGNVATNVSQKQIAEVPNSGNNMTYVTKLTPGMGTGFGVSGSTTLYTVDGMRNNDPYNNSNNSGPSNMMMGINDVQEATVTGNGYSGQFGGLVGAQVSFVTKSGGNRLHGDASWFWTGRSLVANTWFGNHTNTPRPFENVNMWQGAISGPAIKDKLFFYVDTEGLRAVLPSASTTVVIPSANLEAYTLKTLAASGLSQSIPFYQNMFNIYNAAGVAHNAQPGNTAASLTGCPNKSLSSADVTGLGTGPGACTDYYQGAATNFANEWLLIARVDAVLGAHDKAFIRYNNDTGSQPTYTDQISPLFSAVSIQPQHSGQLNETHIFGTRVVNNLILSGMWYGAQFGPSNLPATLALFPAQMTFSDSVFTGLGGTNASFPTGRNVTTMSLQDDVAIDAGNHTIKFGGVGFLVKENDHYFTAGTIPLESVATLGAFIHGGTDPNTPSNNTTLTQSFVTNPNHPIMYSQLGFYGEDDWKMRRDFNMSFAMRIEHQSNVQCLDSCLTLPATPFPSLTHNASIPYDQVLSFNQKNVLPGLQAIEWEPRVGFAYNPPILNQTFVVRGGAGIFFDGLPGNIVESIVKNSPVKNTFKPSNDNLAPTETSNLYNDAAAFNTAFNNSITNGGTLASIEASVPASMQKSFTPPALYGPQNNFKMYQIYKWNLEVQKSFANGATTISVNYLGNHGIHKPYTNAGLNAFSNLVGGLPTTAPDPRFGQVNYIASGGMSNYNGLITTFTQRFRNGNIFTAGYTYGKSMDTITTGLSSTTTLSTSTLDIQSSVDPYNPLGRYAPASSDIRNYLMLNYVYKLPFKNFFYGGWQVAGSAFLYSGLPFTVTDSAATARIASGSTATATSGNYGGTLIADYDYSGEHPCSRPTQAIPCLTVSQFPTGANGLQTANVSSTGPRNGFRGPDYISTDISVTKSIPLHWEGGSLNLGVQGFNVLNHPNFKVPSVSSITAPTFGTITATVNPTGIFSGVGGDDSPRILQVRMKLVF
jgi:hypothetical protein